MVCGIHSTSSFSVIWHTLLRVRPFSSVVSAFLFSLLPPHLSHSFVRRYLLILVSPFSDLAFFNATSTAFMALR